ncbi:hypothetical protein EK0264_07980 [Epidermidibacterium keratini]|uniref:Uncharacterized protein n=1 Tax=Epidermidibacterium keratini TaxID=1891644 RepID=A0A7L4YLS5_9ACTN|nr:hypothetical protein [Epidermidibacterium keratini]QHC00221.1 hypothetical protein EK0264_07980 [Epidermidibacterium keratini]
MSTIGLFVALAGLVVLEGRTILTCLRALAVDGRQRLSRLGSRFLGSEAWVVATIGLAHATYPEAVHTILGEGALGAVAYVAGWMLRDLGLWVGPRHGGPTWSRAAVTLGAAAQAVGAIGVAAVAFGGIEYAGSASGTLLAVVVLPVLAIGIGLQVVLYRIRPAPYFTWPTSGHAD